MTFNIIRDFLNHNGSFNHQLLDTYPTKRYPFYNIVQSKTDSSYIIQLAIAGFSKENLEVTFKDGVLTIQGNKPSIGISTEEYSLVVNNIATRSFTRKFLLSTNSEIDSITLKHGILSITVKESLHTDLKSLPIMED